MEEVCDQLEAIAERLADAAMDRLRLALDGEDGAAADERRMTRARRAVEKAAAILRPPPDELPPDEP